MSGMIRLPTGDILTLPASGPGAITSSAAVTDVQAAAASTTGHLQAAGNPVKAVAGANNGTTPPAPTGITGNDSRGAFTFGSGTSPAAGSQVAVTFAAPFTTPPVVVVSALNPATHSLGVHVGSVTTTGFTIVTTTAPAATQTASTYAVNFVALG